MRVLMIEDDPEIVETVSLAFQMRWPEAKLSFTHLGEKGVEMAASQAPDIVILDLGLPDMSGYDVLKRIRLFSAVPILILTVRSEETDIVKGLEWGADDYLVKPFRQMELLARARALTRRKSATGQEDRLICGPLHFDPSTRQLVCGQKEVNLTSTEGHILHHLMKNAGHVVTHSSLAEAVWGEDYEGGTDSLKVYIRRLREKLEEDPSRPQLILVRSGVGYFLAKPD